MTLLALSVLVARAAPAPLVTLETTIYGGQESALMGGALAAAGDVNGDGYGDVVVSAPWFDGAQPREGRAQVHLGSALGLDLAPSWTFATGQNAATLWAVAGAGDVNGDGYDDVILGSSDFEAPDPANGKAWLFLGSATGLGVNPAWAATGPAASGYGCSVASAGDVNADGFDDVVIGAYGTPNSLGGEGRVYLYLGSAAGLGAAPDWVAESPEAQSDFGVSVASAGDVDGDGFDDVLVGAQYTDIARGSAFLYRGSAAGLGAAAAWTAEGEEDYDYFGGTVASAGDVNGDGYADVAVSAHLYESEGRVWVYLGSAAGLSPVVATILDQDAAGAYFGGSLASAGDVNADGFDDLVTGAPYFDDESGRVSLWLGSAAGLATTPAWDERTALGFLGYAVAGAGDVNGDGVSDVLVGAAHADSAFKNEGASLLYRGSCGALVSDLDADGVDDRCDRCPAFDDAADGDADGIADGCDSCPAGFDPRDLDADLDHVGDACDACPGFDDAADADANGVPDGCEPAEPGDTDLPGDTDGAPDDTDGGAPDDDAPPDEEVGTPEDPKGCGCDSRGGASPGLFGLLAIGAMLSRRRAVGADPARVP